MKIHYKIFRRVTLTGPMEERTKALDWLFKNNYSIRFAGPKKISRGLFDTSRFRLVGQKEINK